jgi:hypothetical protein
MQSHSTQAISRLSCFLFVAFALFVPSVFTPVFAAGTTYYISRSGGSDNNTGTAESSPFASIAKINGLALQPGDSVRFKCGDTWQGEMLRITKSGTAGNPITVGSYPADCADKPVISGSLPVTGWAGHATNIYVADLSAGGNSGKFNLGINQLFRGATRLPFGRWPNIGQLDNGYSTIDAQPAGNRISDNQLPNTNWTGAIAHIKGMRWYILNRKVTGRDATTLTLNEAASCYSGGCTGWGFWLSNHLATLDSEGEWFYDAASKKVYLYTTTGLPANGTIEASPLMNAANNGEVDDRAWGGITLGRDLFENAAYVTVENLAVINWYRHGIATPTNYANNEAHHLIIRNNSIRNVNNSGINLATWVYDPRDNRPAGWRGGYALEVLGNTIDGANSYGIFMYSRESRFADNTLRNIALIANLGASGMGCNYTAGEGGCTQDGGGFMVYAGNVADTGHTNTFERNRLEKIGHNGWLIFSYGNTLRNNVIHEACLSKGDCAGIRPFGDLSKNPNPVRDTLIEGNIIVDTLGTTDGAIQQYKELFGFGINPDYSSGITVRNNVVINSTTWGILYKESTGTIEGNLLYNNAYASNVGRSQIIIGNDSSASLNGNIAFALNPGGRTVAIANPARLLASNNNYFFHPYRSDHLVIESLGNRTFAQWQAATGKDANSKTNWYTQASGEEPRSRVFYNDTASPKNFDLGTTRYVNLDQQVVVGTLTLPAFGAAILVSTGEVALSPTQAIFASADDPARAFTLRNIGGAAMAISAITVSNGFSQTNDCPDSLASNATCTINVRFTGDGNTPIRGTLTVNHNAGDPYTAELLGAPRRVLLPLIRD